MFLSPVEGEADWVSGSHTVSVIFEHSRYKIFSESMTQKMSGFTFVEFLVTSSSKPILSVLNWIGLTEK